MPRLVEGNEKLVIRNYYISILSCNVIGNFELREKALRITPCGLPSAARVWLYAKIFNSVVSFSFYGYLAKFFIKINTLLCYVSIAIIVMHILCLYV